MSLHHHLKQVLDASTVDQARADRVEKVDCWPMPEVRNNIDMTSGNLGLTDKEEDDIVAFLHTLSDGFTRPLPQQRYLYGCYNGKQPGDPKKAAQAIIQLTQERNPPLRLLLGSDAYAAAEKNALARLEEARIWKALSISTDFETE
jgi:hypothetical protein